LKHTSLLVFILSLQEQISPQELVIP